MNRSVITGIGCVGPVAGGVSELAASLGAGRPLGNIECVELPRGRHREMRVARLAPLDCSALAERDLRRMEELSQIWTIACRIAWSDAALDAADGHAALIEPEERGVFLGSGFGCIGATWKYLRMLLTEGATAANPFLFSESVANAPAGHSAIELDARGPNTTLTCGDASATAALAAGARAIRHGRAKLVYCGGVELLPFPLVSVLAALHGPRFLGEGCACLVLESLETARARGAAIYAEVSGQAAGSDPRCPPTAWSTDAARIGEVLRRAAGGCGAVRRVFLHAGGVEAADAAEAQAADEVFPHAPTVRSARVFGCMAAAGGFDLAFAALEASRLSPDDAALVSSCSWGGGLHAVALSGPPR